ncbi:MULTISPECIES: polysaccharide deacetylase family protein [unclassified Nitratiruptor]|uniref:polysaccharide deacetylase family protein n=1 Tax=unclassified Nitratiruptor TaxID=2624044 RepID=UPI00191599DB|nr:MULTISPECIES: polysaccharide deacetylase family protein [unclassified Nitratiruptor]BCD61123.1 polysaccharide deacetylase [Nitratiruptor sp. YY08-10]BCD65056.1 polysaccharide deacetylase [Nitratiruptor sp. YY08-14]
MFQRLLRRSSAALLLACSFLFADAHIFVYHRFGDPRYPSTNTSLAELEAQFTYFKQHHYTVVSLSTLVQALQNGKEIPSNWVILTIDDGFKSFLNALPLFRKFHYPFTLFLATKPIENRYPDYLSWNDLKKIAQYGQIAFHSHAHPYLVDLSDQEIQNDTKMGLELFAKRLGYTPKYYAYPYGEYDERVKKVIKFFGFTAICNQNIGAISKTSSIFDLDRIALVGKVSLPQMLRFNHLDAVWIEPKSYPKNGILERVHVQIDPIYKHAFVYVTGYGWRKVAVTNGIINQKLHLRVSKKRIRVIIKVKNSKISTKILVRSRYGTE